jgi:hypothetical protein
MDRSKIRWGRRETNLICGFGHKRTGDAGLGGNRNGDTHPGVGPNDEKPGFVPSTYVVVKGDNNALAFPIIRLHDSFPPPVSNTKIEAPEEGGAVRVGQGGVIEDGDMFVNDFAFQIFPSFRGCRALGVGY